MQPVCLIIPPSPFLLDERVFPFLGPLKVAAVLEKAGYPVEVLDLSGIKNFLDAVLDHVRTSGTRAYGITATTPQYPAASAIARAIREECPEARLILGGTHATLVVAGVRYEKGQGRSGRAQHALIDIEQSFDVIVSGDGEETIFLALDDDAPKIIDADDRASPFFLSDERLDATPFPARHLIDMSSYRYKIDGIPAVSLIAQLGCPYKCGFCAGRNSPMLRNIRMRSDEGIVEEMLHLHRTYGVNGFMFYDDELNVNTGMIGLMQKIAKTQRDLGVEWKLRGFVKSERFKDDQAQALYEAGFRQLLVGFESGSPRILENIQKIATLEQNTRCVEIAHRHGLKVKALMSLGHPGESQETIADTKRWLEQVRTFDFDATVITPYPGSPYYDQAVREEGTSAEDPVWVYTCKNGDRLLQKEVNYSKEADYYKGNPDDGYVSHVWTDALTPHDLVRLRNELEHDVRSALGIPFNAAAPAALYEHSMGQMPRHVLRKSKKQALPA